MYLEVTNMGEVVGKRGKCAAIVVDDVKLANSRHKYLLQLHFVYAAGDPRVLIAQEEMTLKGHWYEADEVTAWIEDLTDSQYVVERLMEEDPNGTFQVIEWSNRHFFVSDGDDSLYQRGCELRDGKCDCKMGVSDDE